MIDFKCPKCGENMSVPDLLVGQAERCPSCGNAAVVPLSGPPTVPPPPAAFVPEHEGVLIVDRQPMWKRPVSATIGRLNAPMTAMALGTTAPFRPGPCLGDDEVQRVAVGFADADEWVAGFHGLLALVMLILAHAVVQRTVRDLGLGKHGGASPH